MDPLGLDLLFFSGWLVGDRVFFGYSLLVNTIPRNPITETENANGT